MARVAGDRMSLVREIVYHGLDILWYNYLSSFQIPKQFCFVVVVPRVFMSRRNGTRTVFEQIE